MAEIDFTPAESPFGDQSLADAFENVVGELEALAPQTLVAINLDVMSAVNTAAGVIPEVNRLRDKIVADLPSFDIQNLDRLGEYAMALAFAHTAHLVASQPQDHLRPMFEEAVRLRELLVADATTLAKRGLISGDGLQNLKGANGYKNVQADLQMLVHVFRASWDSITGKCATTESELARAEKLVSWLIQAVGLREQGPAEIAKSGDLRVRAFSLFVKAYGDLRRAVSYVRWNEGDVDTIIPSLYQGRGGRKKEAPAPTADRFQAATAEPDAAAGAAIPAAVPDAAAAIAAGSASSNGASTGGPFVS